ncbi:MAG: bifunctional enoyl-CoA hydratase/phosphate acetyltransferase [Xanthomonadaceae bacterium]|jgi:phosphotransacetylase|nr:bifunctional enoyl-CoA hydratase/phosphate acetyltransferase [Xanthomonadaceae bacterium]
MSTLRAPNDLAQHEGFRRLLSVTSPLPAPRTAVAHPMSAEALGAAREAHDEGLIRAILVGPAARLERLAADNGIRIDDLERVPTEHSVGSAAAAVALVRAGKADAVMKGSLHTDEFLHAVLDGATGLRTGRRASHVFVVDVPGFPRPLLVTDAVINIAPGLAEKADIAQNAIELAQRLGIARPRVALLAPVETVNPKIPSTLDAAALCKMADRGQITGGVLEGPLAFDSAIDAESARIKGIDSPVGGAADILLAPDLDSGNILVKQLTFMMKADAAGIVLGTRVPVVLTSRADSRYTRLASCALARLLAARAARPPAG